jgi:hypothetical protein
MTVYAHHVVGFGPGRLAGITGHLVGAGRSAVRASGGELFGVWKPLIGLSLNHAVVLTRWPDLGAAERHAGTVLDGLEDLGIVERDLWQPTLRPLPGQPPPDRRDGYVTHRWYDIHESDLDRFLELSAQTWSSWEGVHAGSVIGLWRSLAAPAPGRVRMRLMAWYRDLGVWERSRYWKRTPGAETANRSLSARYGVTLDSAVDILEPVAGG